MSPKRQVNTASAVIIGGEILSGKIRDENSHALALTLRQLGIDLVSIEVIPDALPRIEESVKRALATSDVVFTSGGVGPTHDDLTMLGVARALQRELVQSERLRQLFEAHYGENLSQAHLTMARLPEGAELVSVPDIRWPTVVVDRVWVMPGVPELFRMKLLVVRENLVGPQAFFSLSLLLREEESVIKEALDVTVQRFPDVEIGSYPKWFDPRYRTKVTFDSRELVRAQLAHEDLRSRLVKFVVTDEPA